VVVHDPELHRRQVRAIRKFLLSLVTRVGDTAASDADVGDKTPGGDDLEGLIGPLEAEVLRLAWADVPPVWHCCVGRSLGEVDRHPWAGVR